MGCQSVPGMSSTPVAIDGFLVQRNRGRAAVVCAEFARHGHREGIGGSDLYGDCRYPATDWEYGREYRTVSVV